MSAISTYATLKQMTANRLGKTDNATANTLRDNAIIDACRQIYVDSKFSWMLQPANVTITSGVGNLPSDFSIKFGIKSAYVVVSGQANDQHYRRVPPQEFDFYPSSSYVYYITWDATNKVFVITTNQTTSFTLKIWYYAVPADLSSDTDVTPIPDPTAIRDLAVANWWLAAERDEANHDRWFKHYEERLNKMIAHDAMYNAERQQMRSYLDNDTGPSTLMTRR